MKHIPNILTFSRIALLPLLIGLIFVIENWAIWTVFALYVFVSITDFLDGYLARKWKVESAIGTFLDPISDKIFVICILVALIAANTIEGIWILAVYVILIRELLVSGLREYLGPKNVQLPVTKLAKWKTTIQMVALGLLLLAPIHPIIYDAGLWGLAIAALLTAITGWGYVKTGWVYLRN